MLGIRFEVCHQWGLSAGNGSQRGKCHQCFPRKYWEMPFRNTQALPAKSYVARPRLVAPGNAFSS